MPSPPTATTRLKLLVDGTVFVLSRLKGTARTGVYFLLRDLVRALGRHDAVELKVFLQVPFPQGVDAGAILADEVAGMGLAPAALDHAGWQRATGTIHVLSGYFPIRPELQARPQLRLYQMVYDLAGHACAELGGAGRDFERAVALGLGARGHAFCISASTRDDLHRHFSLPRERSSVVYPAARTDIAGAGAAARASIAAWIGLPPGVPYVLSLSTLEPRKNLATAIRAFARVVDGLPDADIRWVIAGVEGDADQAALLAGLPAPLRRRIAVIGYVPDDRLPALLSGALCLVYPSLYEGFGMPPLEAMARGTPAIVSDRGSLPEVVGPAGVVVDPFDDAAIAATILRWACDDAERQAWAARGRAQAAGFTWGAAAARIVAAMAAA